MQQMVIVKYHGIKMGVNTDGTPRLLQSYDAGSPLVLSIGEISDPIPHAEALRLRNDFGDAFEIVQEAEIPETPAEVAQIEDAIEAETVAGGVAHISAEEMATQIIAAALMPEDIIVTRRQPFDKTVKPLRYSKHRLGTMQKQELWRIYRALIDAGITDPGLKGDAKRSEVLAAVIQMQELQLRGED